MSGISRILQWLPCHHQKCCSLLSEYLVFLSSLMEDNMNNTKCFVTLSFEKSVAILLSHALLESEEIWCQNLCLKFQGNFMTILLKVLTLDVLMEYVRKHTVIFSANIEEVQVWFEGKLNPLQGQINNQPLEYFFSFVQKGSKKKAVGKGCEEILKKILRN